MQTELDNLLTKVIRLHHSAVQYDTEDETLHYERVSTKTAWVNYEIALKELRDKIQEYSTIIYI